ncbi:hypothetical protein YPPY76_0597, partial [Yersinia pestis PY-76]|jgi:B-box zinc finger
MSHD